MSEYLSMTKISSVTNEMWEWKFGLSRADQNTGSALLEFSMRTAMHGASYVSSALSICHNYQNFATIPSLETPTRWVRCWTVDHRGGLGESSKALGDYAFTKICFSNDFYFSFIPGLVDFSAISIL